MALVKGAWSTPVTVNGKLKTSCTVTYTTGETDAQTLKTPKEIDGSKPFTLFVSSAATPSASALPLKLWIGFADDFAVTGQGSSVVSKNGAYWKQLTDDCVLAVGDVRHAFLIDPDLPVSDVVTVAAIATGYKIRSPKGIPYFVFHLDGTSLNATSTTFTIIQ